MSSEDDMDSFMNLISKQKEKIESKYIECSQLGKIIDPIDSFIVSDEDSPGFDTSESDNHKIIKESLATKRKKIQHRKRFENKSPVSLFSESSDENEQSSIENKSTISILPESNDENEDPKGNNSQVNIKSIQTTVKYEDYDNLFSEDSFSDLGDIFNNSTDSNNSSFERRTPSILKCPLIHSATPYNQTPLSVSKANNEKSLINMFKTPLQLPRKQSSIDNLSERPAPVSEKKSLKTNELGAGDQHQPQTLFVTGKKKKINLESLVKTAPPARSKKNTSKYSKLRPMSDSEDDDKVFSDYGESDNDTDDDDDDKDSVYDFIDDSGDNSTPVFTSEEGTDEDDSDGQSCRGNRFVTPQRPPLTGRMARLVQTVPAKTALEPLDFISSLLDNVDERRRHPEAALARKQFRSQKVQLSRRLYAIYNESVFGNMLPKDEPGINEIIVWSTTLRTTAGKCTYFTNRKVPETHYIKVLLSHKVLTDAERLLETLVHELCHGACWMIDKIHGYHGPQWKQWTKRAHQRFPQVPISTRCHSYDIHCKFHYCCVPCGQTVKRHSKSIKSNMVCSDCDGKFTLFRICGRTGKRILVPQTDQPGGNAFSAFVKQHYKRHRTAGITHQQAMQALAIEFKSAGVNEPVTSTESTVTHGDLSTLLGNIKLTENDQ